MQNYGYAQQEFTHFYFPNSGAYSVDFKITVNQAPAQVGRFQLPQHHNQHQQTVQFQYPGQYSQYSQPLQQYSAPFDQQGQGQGGRGPCDRHHRIFCSAPECQPRALLNDSSMSSISEGGGVATTSWAYTGSRQALALNSGSHYQTNPFGTSQQQQQYETVGSNRGAWNAIGSQPQFASTPSIGNGDGNMGHFSPYSTPPPQKTGCFPKKHCSMM